jgi:hypothetical protein
MVWVLIALAVPLLALLFLFLLRFHFSLDVQTPSTLKGTVGVSLLWFRREIALDAMKAFGDDHDEDHGETEGHGALAHDTAGGSGQRGAIRIPDSILRRAYRLQNRLRDALSKWILDFGVWRLILRFSLKSGRRVLRLLRPRLKALHVGMEDAYDLARIASIWSVVTGAVPALACPVEYGFGSPHFTLKARVSGGFSGLGLLLFGAGTFYTFPWIPLASRFAQCWRDPTLSRWQRRVLLP